MLQDLTVPDADTSDCRLPHHHSSHSAAYLTYEHYLPVSETTSYKCRLTSTADQYEKKHKSAVTEKCSNSENTTAKTWDGKCWTGNAKMTSYHRTFFYQKMTAEFL